MEIMYCHHGNRKINNTPNQNDDLTELGIQDCEIVNKLLNQVKNKKNIKCIYTSQFFRCTKTAQIINKSLNIPIIIDSRLDEFKSIENETWIDCQNRIMNFLKEIIEKHNDNDFVICVTSGVNIAGFINLAYNLTASNDTPFLQIPNCSPIIFKFNK